MSLKRQKYIRLACCVLHNFIKMEIQDDPLFRQYAKENIEVELKELDEFLSTFMFYTCNFLFNSVI